jgi:hypothetical protein
MPEQIKMTHGELAELIAKDVRRHAHCEGFRSISLDILRDGQIPGVNWSEGSTINFGDADQASCVTALREIIPRMQRQYRLVDPPKFRVAKSC